MVYVSFVGHEFCLASVVGGCEVSGSWDGGSGGSTCLAGGWDGLALLLGGVVTVLGPRRVRALGSVLGTDPEVAFVRMGGFLVRDLGPIRGDRVGQLAWM